MLRKIADLESEICETECLGFDVESNEGLEMNNNTNKSKHVHLFLFALFSFVGARDDLIGLLVIHQILVTLNFFLGYCFVEEFPNLQVLVVCCSC